MIIHHILDEVFATWSHVAVLRVLQDSARGLSGREIARLSKMNHRSCLKALTTLENVSIVIRQRGGRDHFFTLNRDNQLVTQGILPLLIEEREFFNKLKQEIKRALGKKCESIIVFGSVSRKQESPESDFDICLVVPTSADTIKIQDAVFKLAPPAYKRFGVKLAPFILTRKEFKRRAKSKKTPVVDILKEGIVISGMSLQRLLDG